jgi:hypothetical protein
MSLNLSKNKKILEKYQAIQATFQLLNLKIFTVIPSEKLLSMSIMQVSLKGKISKQNINLQALILLTLFLQVKDYKGQQLILLASLIQELW